MPPIGESGQFVDIGQPEIFVCQRLKLLLVTAHVSQVNADAYDSPFTETLVQQPEDTSVTAGDFTQA